MLKQCINIKLCFPNYTLELKDTKITFSVSLYWAEIETVTEIHVKLLVIVFKRYPSTYCLVQFSCFICSNFKGLEYLPQN